MAGMLDVHQSLIKSALRKVLKRLHYPLEVMLVCVRWYVAYPLSLRHIEEMMQERGVFVDHTTVHRWALKMLPILSAVCRRRKHPVGSSWRLDETYIPVSGQWKYLYRAVDKCGDTVISCSLPSEIRSQRGAFWKVQSACTMCLRRSPLTKVEPIRRPFMMSTKMRALTSNCARANTSTTWWSKITGRSNGSREGCWGSSHFGVHESSLLV